MKLIVVGHDPSLRNWGIARGIYDTETQTLEITEVRVTNPVLPSGKRIRQNSLDLETAQQLYAAAQAANIGAHAVFVEVPIGSQSARAMASYGVCVGVLGAMRAQHTLFHEITPTEVKLAGPGKKDATKQEMIQWALAAHPEANWPYHTQKGECRVVEGKAEHMADAVATLHAGLASSTFQQLLRLL